MLMCSMVTSVTYCNLNDDHILASCKPSIQLVLHSTKMEFESTMHPTTKIYKSLIVFLKLFDPIFSRKTHNQLIMTHLVRPTYYGPFNHKRMELTFYQALSTLITLMEGQLKEVSI